MGNKDVDGLDDVAARRLDAAVGSGTPPDSGPVSGRSGRNVVAAAELAAGEGQGRRAQVCGIPSSSAPPSSPSTRPGAGTSGSITAETEPNDGDSGPQTAGS